MKELSQISAETLISYKEMLEHVHNKHGKNYKKALDELIQLKEESIDFYKENIKKLVEYSSKCTPKLLSEIVSVMQQVGKGNQKDNDLYQAAFYSAIGNENAAKQQHLKNVLHDTEIIYSREINELKHKLASKLESEGFGAVGGRVFAKKSEQPVFLALDLWRVKYQGNTNVSAANLLLDVVNEKIAELNQAISISRSTRNTPMLEISEPETIAAWIGGLNKLINNKPFPKKARKCIKDYYVNYYLKDKYFSI